MTYIKNKEVPMSSWELFFYTVVLGCIIAFIFDITRILRRVFYHKNLLVQIEDAIFWIISFLIVLYFILNFSEGEIRFFYIIGIFIGTVLYFNTISSYILHFLTKILIVIIKLLKTFLLPCLKIYKNIENLLLKILKSCEKIKTTLKIKLIEKKKD